MNSNSEDISLSAAEEMEEEADEMDEVEVDVDADDVDVMADSNAHDSTLLLSSSSTALSHWTAAIPKDMPDVRDISLSGVWSLSSCKIDGYGVTQLLDEHVDQYWQSDGPQPHQITIEFQSITDILCVLLYLDYKTDESYTPSRVCIQTGSSILDLNEGRNFSFTEPMGWQLLDLRDNTMMRKPAQAFVLSLQVMQNHQNGRDTHIRNMKVIGPGRAGLYDPDEGMSVRKADYTLGLMKSEKKKEEFGSWELLDKPSGADFGYGLTLR